ncbi:MAG: VOC family protein [Pseudomonadales bacterium]
MVRWGLRIFWVLIALLVVMALAAVAAQWAVQRDPVTIDFTRHLATYEAPGRTSERFSAQNGPARLLVDCTGTVSNLQIVLNDVAVLPDADVQCGQAIDTAITLQADNALALVLDASADAAITVRVKQQATVALNVLSRVHFNVNVSDFEASRAFYGALGFSTLSGFPDTNTQAMARAIGVETPTSYDGSAGDHAGGYWLHGELIALGLAGGVIDLIEFAIPRDETPPYAAPNRLGMAYSVMLSNDMDGDYERMRGAGVQFQAAPTARANGQRFALFTDPDGVFYELREADGADGPGSDVMALSGLGALGVNVSDFERSRAWYQMLGYELTEERSATESEAVGRALGFASAVKNRRARLVHQVDGSVMELTQWLQPFDARPPYPIPVNHLGIHRTALATTDIAADVATLRAQGVEFVSPITPCCSGPDSSGSIVAFYDPDGTIVELVEQPAMTWLTPLMIGAGKLF